MEMELDGTAARHAFLEWRWEMETCSDVGADRDPFTDLANLGEFGVLLSPSILDGAAGVLLGSKLWAQGCGKRGALPVPGLLH